MRGRNFEGLKELRGPALEPGQDRIRVDHVVSKQATVSVRERNTVAVSFRGPTGQLSGTPHWMYSPIFIRDFAHVVSGRKNLHDQVGYKLAEALRRLPTREILLSNEADPKVVKGKTRV